MNCGAETRGEDISAPRAAISTFAISAGWAAPSLVETLPRVPSARMPSLTPLSPVHPTRQTKRRLSATISLLRKLIPHQLLVGALAGEGRKPP